jgi:hypothetical protein
LPEIQWQPFPHSYPHHLTVVHNFFLTTLWCKCVVSAKKKKKDSLRPIFIWHFNADTVWI